MTYPTFDQIMQSNHPAVTAYKLHLRASFRVPSINSWNDFRAGWDAMNQATANGIRGMLAMQESM